MTHVQKVLESLMMMMMVKALHVCLSFFVLTHSPHGHIITYYLHYTLLLN